MPSVIGDSIESLNLEPPKCRINIKPVLAKAEPVLMTLDPEKGLICSICGKKPDGLQHGHTLGPDRVYGRITTEIQLGNLQSGIKIPVKDNDGKTIIIILKN